MPKYSTFQASDQYRRRMAGAAIELAMVRSDSAAEGAVIGFSSGHSPGVNFEQVPVEEGGQALVSEIVTGRYDCAGSINGFHTPERDDVLPSGSTYLNTEGGLEYTIFSRIGAGFAGEGTVISAIAEAKLNRKSPGQHGSRGVLTIDLGYVAKVRYTGLEWARIEGNL